MDQQKRLEGFLERCIPGLKHAMAEAMAVRPDFSVQDWMEIQQYCSYNDGDGTQCYTMQVISLKKALEKASTLSDWICIAERTKGDHRRLAFDKILDFDITTDEDIKLLSESTSERLRSVGWYLHGRRHLETRWFKKLNHPDSGVRRLTDAYGSLG